MLNRFFGLGIALGMLSLLALPVTGVSAAEDESVDASQMTPRQMLDYSEESVNEVRGSVRKVLKLVEQAQKDKDVILLNCLNEKLAGLKALLKVVEDSGLGLEEAIARENNDLAGHNLQKIVMARQQAEQLLAEAEACAPGVDSSYAGTGRWSVDVPEDSEDPGQYDVDPEGFVRPPEVSPFT